MISTNGILRISTVKSSINGKEMMFKGNAEFRNGLSSDMSIIGFKLTCGPKDSFYPKLMKEGMQIYASGRLKVVPGKGIYYLELDNATYNMLKPTDNRNYQAPAKEVSGNKYKANTTTTTKETTNYVSGKKKEEEVVIENGYSTQPTYLSKIGDIDEQELEGHEEDSYINENFDNQGGFIPSAAAISSKGLGVLENV